eukprot:TRINITY_DN8677_c0_g1_i1.p1 TRINITY_DN8677_c0_g1~~TRINITY_DN8677_c0_g1_i1.p1  ORF type:complete len:484 (-),score=66.08 TRINITY_DN8677_c0_g1_i1:38-1489(-)
MSEATLETKPITFSFTWGYLRSPDVANEAKEIARLSFPLAISNWFVQLLVMINISFIGHLGSTQLAGIALGTMYCNMFGFTLIWGMLSAVDTLATQAYGAKNLTRVGLIFQRSLLISFLLTIIVAGFWYFSDVILTWAGQEEQVVHYASQYLRRLIFLLPFFSVWESLRRYLQVLSIAAPIAYVSILGVVTNIIGNIIFWNLEWGIEGSAYSLVLAFAVMATTLAFYVNHKQYHKDTWHPWNRECVREWKEYMRFGAPGVVMFCAEWWGYELHAVVSGLISESALAATTVLLNTTSLIFMIPMGISSAAATRVGSALGQEDANGAKRAAWVSIGIVLAIEGVMFVCILAVHNYWGYIFTSDEEVLDLLSKLTVALAVFAVFDSLQGVGGGILRGSGRQVLGAVMNVAVYWLGQLPVATILALLVGWGIYGQWLGIGAFAISLGLMQLVLVATTNWEKLVKETKERTEKVPQVAVDEERRAEVV